MADDTGTIHVLRQAARLNGPRLAYSAGPPQQANAYGFPPVTDLPRARFHPADGGAVRLGVARLDADVVEELLRLFQREAAKTGDWRLHDELSAAASGLTPEPPQAA